MTRTAAGIVTIDPATGDELDFHPYTTPAGIDRAVAAVAASSWGTSRVEDRVAAIGRLGDALARGRERFAALITLEMGKPITQARAEIDKCVGACRHYARELPEILWPETFHLDGDTAVVRVAPLGVVLAILPWNYPWWQVIRAMLPAVGPLGALTTGADDDELIAIANSSRYGLSASVWSAGNAHAMAVGTRIEAGAVFVNTISATDPRLPTGGVKASGYGRELGKWGVRELANIQALRVRTV